MSRELRVVDPYGPYRWNRSFSIRSRSENRISLRGLRIFSRLYRCEGGYGLSISTVRTDGIGCFQSVHDRKIASVRYTVRKMHLIKRLKRKNISIQECCHNKRRARYTYVYRSLSVSDNMTRLKAKENINQGILPQQKASQICMYSSFFKRE